MRSRKLQALDFIKGFFARWGSSPSLGEIAAELGVSNKRAHELVGQLADEGLIRRRKGKHRGLELVGGKGPMSQADALLQLRECGWVVDNDAKTVAPTLPEGAFPPLTNMGLPMLPELDHDPDLDIGLGSHDGHDQGKRGSAP